MCTVTYLPLGETQYILTSNRDESPGRRAESWVKATTSSGETIHFPRDPLKGGTWFAVSDGGRAACLLNGAFEPFQPDPRYTTSRGTVIPDYFQSNRPDQWMQAVKLGSVAPFTLVLHDGNGLMELIWDGHEKQIRNLDTDQPRIWSSVTLYPPVVRHWRRQLFQGWLAENAHFTQQKIMQFHRSAGAGDHENALVMNRGEIVKTLSITSLESAQDSAILKYQNLSADTRTTRHLQINPVTHQS